ncbi:MAG: NAD(P)H-dependent oxidoreductase [Armatimonadetes bacterium]|nr:NAD(P)H-dependent oxidoreductase [Armatimonadota bacterium]
MSKKVAVIVGSLRRNSFSSLVAGALASVAPERLSFETVEIGNLPLFNQDLEEAPPAAWVEFREKVKSADAVLFVTPEYNRSVPGALKNAIDVGSRPYGHSVFNGKPALVVSQSPGAISGFGANHHLRQSLAFLNMKVMGQPEVYIAHTHTLFDESGAFVKDEARQFLASVMSAFDEWIG